MVTEKSIFLYMGIIVFTSIFYTNFAFAAHNVLPINFSINEDSNYLFNISLENTYTNITANVTELEITLPASFSFIASSQGTSSQSASISESGGVLTWTSGGLVMNDSIEYFWFRANASTPGTYNLAVVGMNYTGTSSTDIQVTVNDTTKPSVTSLTENPSDPATYASGRIYEFNATISDNVGINSVLISFSGVNYTVYNRTANVYNFTIEDLASNTYNYFWYVSDLAGNVNNSAGGSYVVQREDEGDGGGGTGGGVAGFWIRTFSEDKEEFKEKGEINYALRKKERIRIMIDEQKHYIGAVTFTDNDVTINVSSKQQQAILGVGDEARFEITDDDYYDINVKIIEIIPNTRVNLTISYLREDISTPSNDSQQTQNTTQTQTVTQKAAEPQNQGSSNEDIKNDEGGGAWIIVLVIVIIILVIGVVAYFILLREK